jgi:anaerobic magnesium-protoporphyrin IX monomethyl ester cyclase
MSVIALIFPRFRYPSGDFPIGIALLASYIRKHLGWEVVICDTTFSPSIETIQTFLENTKPDIVGVGMSTLMLGEGLQACRLAKDRGCSVFVGGPHPTTKPQEMMQHPFIDACVIGEGELITVNVLKMLQKNQRHTIKGAYVRGFNGEIYDSHYRQPVENLDELPFPAWDLLDMNSYISSWGQLDSVRPGIRGVNITASRGCPFSCTFCQPVLDNLFGKKLRQRSPESVIEELQELHRRYKIDAFWFTDDTFTTNRKWVHRFCIALKETGMDLFWGCTTRANLIPKDMMQEMYDVGLRKIGIGLESATDRIREELYQKGVSDAAVIDTVRIADKLGVQTLLFLMLGAPGESRKDMLATIELATSLPSSEASFSLFVPIPGTSLHKKMINEGYVMSEDYVDYDYYSKQPFTHELSRLQLRLIQRYAYLRFYTHPRRWEMLRMLFNNEQGVRSVRRKLHRILPTFTTG